MNKSSYIARGGLFTALSILTIYLSSIITGNKLFFLGVSSLIIPICVLMMDVKYALLVYLSSSIISLSILGPRQAVVAYILFFGLYGIIKFYIEKINKPIIEIALKLLFFNAFLGVIYYVLQYIIFDYLSIKHIKYKFVIFIGLQFLFLFYDYILTIFIDYISKKLKNFKH